jgi:NAD(P)-dependent dehydrogenase (short-subunit alcohol dehydrogenase family)
MTTWLITGCSTGLGRALAQTVLAHGHNAVVTARNVNAVKDIAADFPGTALALPLDVTDKEQISSDASGPLGRADSYPLLGEQIRRRRFLQTADDCWERWS